MTTKPDFPMALDSTMITSFRACPQLYFKQYFHHWKPLGQSVDLVAGGAFARGIEVVRKATWDEQLPPSEALQKGVIALIKDWGDFEAPEGHKKQLDRMIGALDEYFAHYGYVTDYITPLMQDDKGAIEFSFALPIPGIFHPTTNDPILYTGRFDMLGLFNNQIFVIDEKTTSYLGASWLKNWTMRSQITAYCWAAREYGHEVAGGIIRGISILKTKYGHAESIQYRPDWFIDKWLSQVQKDATRMIEAWKTDSWDYDFDTSCTNYGGCRFMDVCSSQNEQRVLEQNFVKRIWDPLTRTEEEVKG